MKHAILLLGAALIYLGTQAPAGAQQAAIKRSAAAPATLGPGDEVSIEVVELPEFSAKAYRIDADGSISLPLIGRVQAGGLTLAQFETQLRAKLHSQVQDPHVVTNVVQTRSQPVSVMGAVNLPGTQQLQGQSSLFDVLASAGGLKADAGDIITITRQADQGPLNVPGAIQDPANGRFSGQVTVHDVVDLKDPRANIQIRPRDEISVSRARVLYVIGNVKKAGGFTLSDRGTISALEALSLAEGLAPNAQPTSARILRKTDMNSLTRVQIPVNLKKILAGKAEDIQMSAGDILFVPDNAMRRITARTAETALATVSGLIIWRGL